MPQARPGVTSVTDSAGDQLNFGNQVQLARIGLNYRFGGPQVEAIALPTFNWSGFYAGLLAGPAGLTSTGSASIGAGSGNDDLYALGATAGVDLGFNWQFAPNFVAGLEADASWLGGNRTYCDINDCGGLVLQMKNDFLATLRVRAGYAFNRSLLYVTGGAAYMNRSNGFIDFGGPMISRSAHNIGWTAGGGLETALNDHWTLKTEYLYVNTGTNTVVDPAFPADFISFKNASNVYRVGLNYKF